jgi:hypothetical protein
MGLLLVLASCQRNQLRASRFQVFDLDGLAEVSLPSSLERLPTLGRKRVIGYADGPQQRLLGDHSANPEDSNFAAVSHGFRFGQDEVVARLLISRLEDVQAFSPPSVYFRWSLEVHELAANPGLEWKKEQNADGTILYHTQWSSGPQSTEQAWMVLDKAKLLQMVIWGRAANLREDVALEILKQARESYALRNPLDGYFKTVKQVLQAMAERRRKNYLALLNKLEEEELDYSPTPKVVLFNRNLACQFWSRNFDNSGVPWEFAIAARLGIVENSDLEAWKKVPAIPLVAPFFWPNPSREVNGRIRAVLEGAGWQATDGAAQAFAGLHFDFAEPIPDLSDWLTGLDQYSRAAQKAGLIAPR